MMKPHGLTLAAMPALKANKSGSSFIPASQR
jgi:hypothetical protein